MKTISPGKGKCISVIVVIKLEGMAKLLPNSGNGPLVPEMSNIRMDSALLSNASA